MTKIIQLRTGQFLIGKCSESDDGTVTIDRPLELILQQVRTPDGVVPQVGLAPYAMFVKTGVFTFSKDQLQLTPQEPEDGCAKAYLEATTGLQMAGPNEMPQGLIT